MWNGLHVHDASVVGLSNVTAQAEVARLTHVYCCFAGVGRQQHTPSWTVMTIAVIQGCIDGIIQ